MDFSPVHENDEIQGYGNGKKTFTDDCVYVFFAVASC